MEEHIKLQSILEAVLDNLGTGICVLDKDLRVLYVNKWMQDRFPQTEVGSICYETFGEGKEPCQGCPVLKCLETGKMETSKFLDCPSGRREFFSIDASPIRNQDGQIIGAVEIISSYVP